MKLLVAIDGSSNSIRALQFAIDLARGTSAPSEIVIVNAHDDAALRGASQFVGKEAVDGYLDDLARSELAQAIELAAQSKVPFTSRMLRGQVAHAIVQEATATGCDMILLGSKGRTALKDLLIGSIAQRVVSIADVPVTLVK